MKTIAGISKQTDPAGLAKIIRNLMGTTCRQNPLCLFGNFSVRYRFDVRKGDRVPVIIIVYSPRTGNKNLMLIVGEVKLTDYRWYQKYNPHHLYKAWRMSEDRTGYFRNMWNYTQAFMMVIRIIVELKYYSTGSQSKK